MCLIYDDPAITLGRIVARGVRHLSGKENVEREVRGKGVADGRCKTFRELLLFWKSCARRVMTLKMLKNW